MTCLNVWVSPSGERALVATDTHGAVILPDGTTYYRQVSKLFPLCAAQTILAGRGTNIVLGAFHMALMLNGGDYDGLLEHMPLFVQAGLAAERGIPAETRSLLVEKCRPVEAPGMFAELALVGWSSARRRVDAWLFRAYESGSLERVQINEYMAPWHESYGRMSLATRENMLRCMREQVAHAEATVPGAGHGGRCMFASIDEHRIALSCAGTLDRQKEK